MTREVLVRRAKELIEANDEAVRRIHEALRRAAPWREIDPRTGRDPLTAELISIARAFVEQNEPKWLDKPDSDGSWWLHESNDYLFIVEVSGIEDKDDDAYATRIDGEELQIKYITGRWLKISTPPKEGELT